MFNPVIKYLFKLLMTSYIHVVYVVLLWSKLTVQTREHCCAFVSMVDFEHIQKNTYLTWVLIRTLNNYFVNWSLSTTILVILKRPIKRLTLLVFWLLFCYNTVSSLTWYIWLPCIIPIFWSRSKDVNLVVIFWITSKQYKIMKRLTESSAMTIYNAKYFI